MSKNIISPEQMALTIFKTATLNMRNFQAHCNKKGYTFFQDVNIEKVQLYSLLFSYNFMTTVLSKKYSPSVLDEVLEPAYSIIEEIFPHIGKEKLNNLLKKIKRLSLPLFISPNYSISLSKVFLSFTTDSKKYLDDSSIIMDVAIELTAWMKYSEFIIKEYKIKKARKSLWKHSIHEKQLAEHLAAFIRLSAKEFYEHCIHEEKYDDHYSFGLERLLYFSYFYQFSFIKNSLSNSFSESTAKRVSNHIKDSLHRSINTIIGEKETIESKTRFLQINQSSSPTIDSVTKTASSFIYGVNEVDDDLYEDDPELITDIAIELLTWKMQSEFLVKEYEHYSVL
ncbi:MAG: hypothetical protein IJC46_06595 [Clostridia bacterium]|nr:hypothetical protein [Clostridia bacterium]